MTIKNLKPGLYVNPFKANLKIVNVEKRGSKVYAEMFFTNNPVFGKSRFGIETPQLKTFLKGYKLKKI